MKPEDKKLLLQDLCARLPYHVIVKYRDANVDLTKYVRSVKIEECKPYLRPMSSMTEEERIELDSIPFSRLYKIVEDDLPWSIANYRQLDWLNVNHFDYRGLIQKGLALEASEEMYNLKEK